MLLIIVCFVSALWGISFALYSAATEEVEDVEVEEDTS